jgi:hypothetical protein
MSETADRPTSRRAFAVAAAGGLALAATLASRATAVPETASPDDDAITNALAAPPAASNATGPLAPTSPPPPPPGPNSPARARDLGKLSNILYNNPAERALFLADPSAYAVRLGLHNISAADLGAIRNNVADGFCCMGCGC